MSYDVFISWTGADIKIKEKIAECLKKSNITPLLSDEQCQGNFVEWSREAATSTHIFMTIITDHSLLSKGMQWELEEIDKKLCSDEGEFWKNIIIPVCQNFSVFEQYKAKLSFEGQKMLETLSAIMMETDEAGMPTEKCLKEICDKTAARIIYHMHTLYREKTKPDYIKLIPLCDIDVADSVYPFEKLYIRRSITEMDANKKEIRSFETPEELLSGGSISFLYGPAGCGKTQYINEIRACTHESSLLISLSCADVSADKRELFEIMYEDFINICGNRGFYTKDDFNRLLKAKQLILVLDGMDEITTKAATRVFVEKTVSYYKANRNNTTLIFTGRNEKDADILLFEDVSLRRFRLDKLTDAEIEKLGNNLFLLFDEEDKYGEFYVSVKDLSDEIRANPLLLSQLAIVYKDRGDIPQTVVGILDAVSSITLRSDKLLQRNLQAVPELYRKMISHDISGILKSFARERYEKTSQGKNIEFSKIFNHILKDKYKEKGEACRERTEFLLEYLRNRAIFADGKFYHKMFLEYFTAVSYYEDSFDEDYGEIEDIAVINELFSHYHDEYWREVIKLFLVKADSCIDGETTQELYEEILSNNAIAEYTLLFDVCRELIVHKREASLVLVKEILEKSANGEYPAYGPLFWYVPEYELYEIAVLAADTLAGNAKALALVRDVCFIFGRKYTVAEITDEVDGKNLYQAVKSDLSGVREGLLELFCIGKTDSVLGTDIYPRCFNIAEAKSFMEYGHGVFGRMSVIFEDELGLWEEDYPELGGEYIGFVSCPYNKAEMELKLNRKSTVKVRGLALINTENIEMDYVEFVRTSVRMLYVPENTECFEKDYALFMGLDFAIKIADGKLIYIFQNVRKIVVPEHTMVLRKNLYSNLQFLEEVYLPQSLLTIEAEAFSDCSNLQGIIIPDSVTKIGQFAFKSCINLQEINIPNSLETIEKGIFVGCSSLNNILISDSVMTIEDSAFLGCKSLNNVSIPNTVITIGDNAFADCTNLSNIIISDSIEVINLGMFFGCTKLSNITIPNSVTEIRDAAFFGCTNLSNITIPNSVTYIGKATFKGCTNLANITIPNSVIEIGDYAFSDCTNLANITIPNSVIYIGSATFEGCTNLTNITIPNSVTEIGDYAFSDCTNLTNITIPNSVIEIGDYAFQNCVGFNSITIPNSIIKIGEKVFENCTNLKEIVLPQSLQSLIWKFPSSTKIICKETNLPFSIDEQSVKVFIQNGKKEIFDKEFQFSNMENISFPYTLEIIGSYAFFYCKNLRYISIPNSVKVIRSNAFQNCESLATVIIPDSVTEIGKSTFQGCENLTSMVIPNSVKIIESSTFQDCRSLNNIIIPDSVTKIGNDAFLHCESLKDVIIPDSVTEIGDGAFARCESLSTVIIPNSITEIGEGAFQSCKNLRKIIIPDFVTEIANHMFQDCINLSNIVIPKSVTKIGGSGDFGWGGESFSGCIKLKSIDIPNSVTEIGEGSFKDCNSLIEIIIPNSVTKIGNDAFLRCESLKDVIIPDSVTEIGDGAFARCESLSNIIIPNSVTEIGQSAFQNCKNLRKINIPDSVTVINGGLFFDCLKLSEIALSNSITKIGYYAFADCISLDGIIIPVTIKEIEGDAFLNCSSLTVLDIPQSVRHIGDNAFAGCTGLTSVALSANFKNDVSRIFGDIDVGIIKWID